MLKIFSKYLLIAVILLIGIPKEAFAISNHPIKFSSQEENIFDNVSIESAFINEHVLKPYSQNSEGTIDVEPKLIEEDENEDEDENISHKKLNLKNSSSISLFFAPSLNISQGFFKKHYFSYISQFKTSATGKYKVLEVFRL